MESNWLIFAGPDPVGENWMGQATESDQKGRRGEEEEEEEEEKVVALLIRFEMVANVGVRVSCWNPLEFIRSWWLLNAAECRRNRNRTRAIQSESKMFRDLKLIRLTDAWRYERADAARWCRRCPSFFPPPLGWNCELNQRRHQLKQQQMQRPSFTASSPSRLEWNNDSTAGEESMELIKKWRISKSSNIYLVIL